MVLKYNNSIAFVLPVNPLNWFLAEVFDAILNTLTELSKCEEKGIGAVVNVSELVVISESSFVGEELALKPLNPIAKTKHQKAIRPVNALILDGFLTLQR